MNHRDVAVVLAREFEPQALFGWPAMQRRRSSNLQQM
jgi:hypothetical protein